MNFNFQGCNIATIQNTIPHHVWESQVYDRLIPVEVVRIFHNKLTFLFLDSSECYFSYFSPEYFFTRFGFAGVVLFFTGLVLLTKANKRYLFLVLLYPLPFILFGR